MTKTKKNKECQLKKLELLNKIVGKDVTKCPKCEGTLKLISKVYKNKPPDII